VASEAQKLQSSPAHQAFLAGDFGRAIRLQVDVVNEAVRRDGAAVQEKKLLALYLFQKQDFRAAEVVLRSLLEAAPEDSEVPENLGVILRKLGRYEEALAPLQKALELAPDRPNILDALAHTYGNLGDAENCRRCGERSLELKDAQALRAAGSWRSEVPESYPEPLPFRYGYESAFVVSFSLFGGASRYVSGALRNAELLPVLYPGWKGRFYCDDTVPEEVRRGLRERGCEVVLMPPPKRFYEGLFWRFRVWEDPHVKRFLVRDCDSLVNVKERVAVDAWLQSGRCFHVMRDFYSHTELILAGRWGGVAGLLPPVETLAERVGNAAVPTRTFDQVFLREAVWPYVRRSVLIHDSWFPGALGGTSFPPYGGLPPDRHIGQNEAVHRTGGAKQQATRSRNP